MGRHTPPGQTPPGQTPPGQTPPRQTPPLGIHTPRADTPPPGQTPPWVAPRDGYCSGWYASYWNGFLLILFLLETFIGQTPFEIIVRCIPNQLQLKR